MLLLETGNVVGGFAVVVLAVASMARPPIVPDRLWRFACWLAVTEIVVYQHAPAGRWRIIGMVAAPVAFGVIFAIEAHRDRKDDRPQTLPIPVFTIEPRYLGSSPPQVRLFVRNEGPGPIRQGALLNLLVPRALVSFRGAGPQPGQVIDSDENLDSGTGAKDVAAWLWTSNAPATMEPRIAYPFDYLIDDPRPGAYPFLLRIVQDEQRKEAAGDLTIPDGSAKATVTTVAQAPTSLGTATPGELGVSTVRATLARLIEEGAANRDRYTDRFGMKPNVDGVPRDPDEMKARIAEWVDRAKQFVARAIPDWADEFRAERLWNLKDGSYVREYMDARLNELRSIRERVPD